jgi:hypothetical protein
VKGVEPLLCNQIVADNKNRSNRDANVEQYRTALLLPVSWESQDENGVATFRVLTFMMENSPL